MGLWQDILGTTQNFFRIGLTGVRLKNVGGNLTLRNASDTADAQVTAATVNVSGDSLVINSDATNTGADRSITLARPVAGMGASYTLTLPVDDGSPNQALTTDGNGVLSWVSQAGTADKLTVDSTALAFGSTSPVALFTLPANAAILSVQIAIDTAFNGTPSVSVGISGSTAKYFAATQVDLTAVAGTVFEVYPGQTPAGSAENLIATYTAGGATAGAARILVSYATPA